VVRDNNKKSGRRKHRGDRKPARSAPAKPEPQPYTKEIDFQALGQPVQQPNIKNADGHLTDQLGLSPDDQDKLLNASFKFSTNPNGSSSFMGRLNFSKGDDGRLTPNAIGVMIIAAGILPISALAFTGNAVWAGILSAVFLAAALTCVFLGTRRGPARTTAEVIQSPPLPVPDQNLRNIKEAALRPYSEIDFTTERPKALEGGEPVQ